MPGYRVTLDEKSSAVELETSGGVPFKFAVQVVLEELAGIRGDIDEGDVSGRVAEDKDIYSDLEERSEEMEKLTEADIGGKPLVLNEQQQAVLDALIAEGEQAGYITMWEEGELPKAVQKFLEGKKSMTFERLLDIAEDYNADKFLEKLGRTPAPTPSPV